MITVSYVAGERLIDMIVPGADPTDIRAVSANYGAVLAQFLDSPGPPGEGPARAYIAGRVGDIHAALRRCPRWQSAPVRRGLSALDELADAAPPMMCKTDWSASNMLMQGDTVACLYDFDTAYIGNRLTFLGDILCSTSVRLDWPAVREGLVSAGVAMPASAHLAAAAHFSRWQVQLARASQDDLGWPGPAQFAAHLERLTALARAD